MELNNRVSQLAKRRGFYFQSSEAYGGVAGFQTFGPQGAELKRNIEESWRNKFSRGLGHREIEAPTVMPEAVFEASGHLEGFDDMIIECPECGKSIRADHLVEDHTSVDEAEGFSTDQIEALIEEHKLECSSCGHNLSGIEVEDFNLMFETSIGPGDSQKGFLRPETAQGIFVEFPRLKQYARGQLPFGITQIGKAYRNEISPRKGLVRVREFTQAELEHFIDPEEDSPNLREVENVELTLYPADKQENNEGYVQASVSEAVEEGILDEWTAYYLGKAKEWYIEIGIDPERLRFRQHMPDELSHYASDCWDAEADIEQDEEEWLEITGFGYRGCYDLKKHAEHSGNKKDYQIFKEYDEPQIDEEVKVDVDMSELGPEYGEDAQNVADIIENKVRKAPEIADQESIFIHFDEEEHAINSDFVEASVEEVKKSGEYIFPEVVEPSFGIGRILYTLLIHSYEEDIVDDEERKVLKLSSKVSPVEVAVFPLMDKDGLGEKAKQIASELRESGLSVKYDDSGNIGKRYRRQDEIGTPLCITVDYETLENQHQTVTVRERDSTDQQRVKINELEEHLSSRL